ncbi:MAG: hypothetical protein AVDCRST_MAG05-525, partial [uncultured Rubrobacteraceae bacterium]
ARKREQENARRRTQAPPDGGPARLRRPLPRRRDRRGRRRRRAVLLLPAGGARSPPLPRGEAGAGHGARGRLPRALPGPQARHDPDRGRLRASRRALFPRRRPFLRPPRFPRPGGRARLQGPRRRAAAQAKLARAVANRDPRMAGRVARRHDVGRRPRGLPREDLPRPPGRVPGLLLRL